MLRKPSWAAQALIIARKDLAIELATGEIVTTSGFFAVLVAVVASLAFYAGADATVRVAPGVIWVAVSFASVLALSRTWQREREDGAINGLLSSPVARSAHALAIPAPIWMACSTLSTGVSAPLPQQ